MTEGIKNNQIRFSLAIFVLIGIGLFTPQVTHAFGLIDTVMGVLSLVVTQVVMPLFGLVTWLGAVILNKVILYTVVNMSENLSSDGGIIPIWQMIRDLANMAFIFVLLYASIRVIIGQEGKIQNLIKNIVIAAILVNFSLFFTKLVIDASNLLALTFYDAIAPGALGPNASIFKHGISNSLMDMLKVQSAWDITNGSGTGALIAGIMASITALIAGFIFFAVAIMFVIRYVVLIFILALSPLAFVANALPALKPYSKQWQDALVGQAFFAPIYFFLTWLVIKVGNGLSSQGSMSTAFSGTLSSSGTTVVENGDAITTVVNFIIIIALLVTSLMVAKQWASKAGGHVTNLTKWATGKAGGLAFGGAALAGRKTLGWYGNQVAGDPDLIKRAATEKGMDGFRARLNLGVAKKMASGSFDVRRASIPGRAFGEAVEGTIGRTRIGKKLNLDVVDLPNLEVGQRAASEAGIGKGSDKGYKETKDAKDKILRDRAKESAATVRKADAKIAIKAGEKAKEEARAAGTTSPAQQAAIDAMVKEFKKMSEDEIKNQKATTLAITEVAEALSQKQVDAIEKSGNYTAVEIQNIKDARSVRLNTAFTAGPGPMPGVTTTPGTTPPTGIQTAIKIMRKMDAPTLAKLPAGPGTPSGKARLDDANILELYTPGLLTKLAAQNDFTVEKMDVLRTAILSAGATAAPGTNLRKSYDWLTTGAGKDIFS